MGLNCDCHGSVLTGFGVRMTLCVPADSTCHYTSQMAGRANDSVSTVRLSDEEIGKPDKQDVKINS